MTPTTTSLPQNDANNDDKNNNNTKTNTQKNYQYLRKHIVHISGENPNHATLSGTNCYILGKGRCRTLVEAPGGVNVVDDEKNDDKNEDIHHQQQQQPSSDNNPTFLNNINAFLDDHNDVIINRILITHAHDDHFGGINDVMNLLRLRQAAAHYCHDDSVKQNVNSTNNNNNTADESVVKAYKLLTGNKFEKGVFDRYPNLMVQDLNEGGFFVIDDDDDDDDDVGNDEQQQLQQRGQWHVEGIHTPGHLDDHMSFLLTHHRHGSHSCDELPNDDDDYDSKERILICGDLILGTPSGAVEDLSSYMNSLALVQSLNVDFLLLPHSLSRNPEDILIPAKEKIEGYISYQERRMEALRSYFSVDERNEAAVTLSRSDLFQRLYGEMLTNGGLIRMAYANLDLRINKLIHDGIIEKIESDDGGGGEVGSTDHDTLVEAHFRLRQT